MRVGITDSRRVEISVAKVGQGWVSGRRDLHTFSKFFQPFELALATFWTVASEHAAITAASTAWCLSSKVESPDPAEFSCGAAGNGGHVALAPIFGEEQTVF